MVVKKKVCLLGEGAVGKTSLIRRFVTDQFDDQYIATIGTKVTKKEIVVKDKDDVRTKVDMTIWDIMGQEGFRELLKQSYFYGASGVIAVCDSTRMDTCEALEGWIEEVWGVAKKKVPMVFFANKTDLPETEVTEEDIDKIAKKFGTVGHMTSARTGENVEEGFEALAQTMLASDN